MGGLGCILRAVEIPSRPGPRRFFGSEVDSISDIDLRFTEVLLLAKKGPLGEGRFGGKAGVGLGSRDSYAATQPFTFRPMQLLVSEYGFI